MPWVGRTIISHAFHIGRIDYEIPDPDEIFPSKARDERRVRLQAVVATVGTEFGYVYDFGDGWEHRLLLEAIALGEPGVFYPRCVQGARSGPPEDVLALAAMKTISTRSPIQTMMSTTNCWHGADRLIAERFDRAAVNQALRKEFSPKTRQRSSG